VYNNSCNELESLTQLNRYLDKNGDEEPSKACFNILKHRSLQQITVLLLARQGGEATPEDPLLPNCMLAHLSMKSITCFFHIVSHPPSLSWLPEANFTAALKEAS